MRSFAGIRSASPACWPDSMANSALDSARLRTITALASCVLNSRRPMRASSAMVRTMLAIPARVCSCRRHRGHRGLGGGGQIGDHPIEDTADEFVLVGEAFVEVAGGQPGPAAHLADGQPRRCPAGPLPAASRPAASSRRRRVASRSRGLDAAVRPRARGLRHEHHLDTNATPRQYQETSVLTVSGRCAREGLPMADSRGGSRAGSALGARRARRSPTRPVRRAGAAGASAPSTTA